jgi:hypothetical protein
MPEASPGPANQIDGAKQAFAWKAFDIPHALIGRATLGFAVLAALLGVGAWLLERGLTDRQIAGTVRVLGSLDTEASVFEQLWSQGDVPATMQQAEQAHIDEEQEQQTGQLADLSKAAANG